MKRDEIKLRINNYVLGLADSIFPGSDLINKLKATTAKYWIKQNLWKLDNALGLFEDEDGDIDPSDVIEFFCTELDGKISISLKDFSDLLPAKKIILQKDDLMRIFKDDY